ncbi:uncharacterized protein BP01DRAFT_353010 [Aspergillus saccharolyticus JOP 1030-1]|uniref:CBM-cenC domain-containing protein n=1 Tax=Aspergillus saccharolyticus JOP 1030-1 TaxID=1450539 RepID=A0A318ZWL5_9EURO|nr:hypothetical protein BP01DRAFT_353010 [Aspergillus saccharolyticus JOP 1030-1]PYH48703.1 hypothetical protein BP01DRAFT_353010 [Aspergillus saccharolyticus JOP 1030-1]
MAKPLLIAAVISSLAARSLAAVVTCNNEIVNAFSNPSFETGDASDWTAWIAAATPRSMGQVLSGEASEGEYYLSMNPDPYHYTYIEQSITGLEPGQSYTLSVDYKLSALASSIPSLYNQCYLGWMLDGWSSFYDRITLAAAVGGADPAWSTYSIPFTSTTSSHTMMLVFSCNDYTTYTFDFDNILLPLSTQQVCTTSTPVVTPTPSSVAISTLSTTPTPLVSASSSSVMASSVVASSSAVSSPSSVPPASSPAVPTSIPVASPLTPSPASPSTRATSGAPSSSVAVSAPISLSQSAVSSRSSASVPAISPVASLSPKTTTRSLGQSSAPSVTPSSVRTFATSRSQPGRLPSSVPVIGSSQAGPHGMPTPATGSAGQTSPQSGPTGAGALTTSTILTTRTATVTACPSDIPDCPASQRTTSLTTETVVIGTTVCPITVPAGRPTGAAGSTTGENSGPGQGGDLLTTSTVFTTRTSTILACPSTVRDCPASARSTYVVTETLVDYTTVCPITATQTAVSRTTTSQEAAMTGSNSRGHATTSGAAPAVTEPAAQDSEVVSTIYYTTTVTVDCPV